MGAVEAVALVVDALLVTAAVLAPGARARGLATVAAALLTPALLVNDLAASDRLDAVTGRPLVLAAGGAFALVVLAAGAVIVTRRPALLALAAVVAMPFRVPLGLGGGDAAYLLVPLYGVIAVGVLASAARELRGRELVRYRGAGRLEWLLFGSVILYTVQASYSTDLAKALEQVVFFYVPFALLYKLLVGLDWTPPLLRQCLVALLALAALFCAVGFFQYATHTVWINDKLLQGNRYTEYFRVNSLFFDPNVYGRFLVVAMLALTAAALWTRDRRAVPTAAAPLAILWLGLLTTRSESSLLALVVGTVALAVLRDGARRLVSRGAVAALAGAFIVVAIAAFAGGASLRKATSGRSDLVRGGVELFTDRPVWGWGSGAFSHEYRRQGEGGVVSASHTIPVTVAAEQGLIGLGVYIALLIAAFRRLFRRAGTSAGRAAVASIFAALVLHTLLYAAFLEDPLTWMLLAAGVALSAAPAPQTSSRATSLSPTSM